MAALYPLQLLKTTLEEHEVSLQKSINLYNQKLIDEETHLTHKQNLKKLIEAYQYAIYILEQKG
jgi:hypothetical protein